MKTTIGKLDVGDIFYLSGNPKCQVRETEMIIIENPDYIEPSSNLIVAQDNNSEDSNYVFKKPQIVYKKTTKQ
tara:strand:+ start:597 stop:815 length:219 start_codon:yes stop_codon:yes gene_type:complete